MVESAPLVAVSTYGESGASARVRIYDWLRKTNAKADLYEYLGAWVSSQLPCSFLEQEDGNRRERLVWRKKTTENPIRRSNPAPPSLTDPRSQ